MLTEDASAFLMEKSEGNLIYLLFLIIIMIPGIHLIQDGWNKNYMDPETTASVNGWFILLVFYRHLASYRSLNSPWFSAMNWADRHTGQLIVACFLFFSGYGIMENIRRKGKCYIQSIPRHRILRTWFRFACIVILYIILRWAVGDDLSFREMLMALTGWESVGNSNWYIFVILCLYALTWLAAEIGYHVPIRFSSGERTFPERHFLWIAALQGIMSMVLILGLRQVRPEYWYNTIFAYTAGMGFSAIRYRWEQYTEEKSLSYPACFAVLLILWLILMHFSESIIAYEAAAVLTGLSTVMILRKIKFGNPVLHWMGKNLFGLYMGQRIVMILLQKRDIPDGLYMIICAAAALLIGWILNEGTAAAADWLAGKGGKKDAV